MKTSSPSSLLALVATIFLSSSNAFVVRPQQTNNNKAAAASTRLFLEDRIADLIDDEIYRQSHKKEFEKEWMEKNREAIFHRMKTEFMPEAVETPDEDFRQHNRDKNLADKDPQAYCADRCVATGNCDIYEEFFDLSAKEVLQFCTECVLNEDEDSECEIPEAFFDDLMP